MLCTTKMHPVRQDLFGLFHIFVICLRRISTHFDVNSASGSSNSGAHRKKRAQTNAHTTLAHIHAFIFRDMAAGNRRFKTDEEKQTRQRDEKKPWI